MDDLLVIGGGMAGLSAALVARRAGLQVTLLEQAEAFSEVGAGIQLGPNAVRVLHDWGLLPELRAVAAFPERLSVRDARSGGQLGGLTLGAAMQQRYGQPYATIHRADLHQILLRQLQGSSQVDCRLRQRLHAFEQDDAGVRLRTEDGSRYQAGALLGCDGLWSRVRGQLLADGAPVFSGDLAYRGLVPMAELPPELRRNQVTAWLAPGLHAVHYPVRAGTAMNVIVVVEGPIPPDPESWDQAAQAPQLRRALGPVHGDLDRLLQAVPDWRLWPLNARAPMRGPQEHAQGRVALLGDAAHPTRPYLAQGAAMALEDAWTLGQLLAQPGWRKGPAAQDIAWPGLLQALAQTRWRRNAWIQQRSRRNGQIFHAAGPLRWGRNLAMAALGEGLLDLPRLYQGPPAPN
ncbi:FAD-dependent oxidoreductase [Malikia granosa]|uniref:FAD-dependent oxidoreductase n=1 Tax=Malikia granosa TaxID=263067 RepID=A0A2S9K1L2_9BURK|nr:FAD-dependent oxidoreductase [Malikia granosa]PRD64333.1 FAD-dependent oxidoreductase [Malikia granosa]